MTKLYSDADVQPEALKGQRIVILGYGSQGRAQAMNLKDSGFDVTIALRPGGKTWAQAEADGFKPKDAATACKDANVISLLLPDTEQPKAYEAYVAPFLKAGTLLMFEHGFNIHYGDATGGEIKLTIARYFPPSDRNIDKLAAEQDKTIKDWGVKPDRGYEVKLTKEEQTDLAEFMRNLEVIPPKGSKPKEAKPFEDKQREKALEYLREQVKNSGGAVRAKSDK